MSQFPLCPMPWGWTQGKVDGEPRPEGRWTAPKQTGGLQRLVLCGRETSQHCGQIQAFKQLAAPQTHQPQPVPTARRCPSCWEQRSDAKEQLPAGTSGKQLKEEAERPQMGARDEATPGKHKGTLPPSALLTSAYFYPCGFPKPSIVSVIHQPTVKLFQLLILSPLKAIHFLQPSPAIPKVYYEVSEQVLNLHLM